MTSRGVGLVGLVLLGWLAAQARSQALDQVAAEPPELLDQHGLGDGLRAHRGRLVVGLVAELRALRHIKAWEIELRDRLGPLADEIRFLRVADAPDGRGITRQRVLEKLEGRVPSDVSILIDLEGAWRRAFGLETHRPNVLLFDRRGRLVHTIRGSSEPELADRIAAWIRQLDGSDR